MRPRTRALLSSLAGVALAASGVIAAGGASAAPRQPLVYDALGDSYASGVGAGDWSTADCGRSQTAYAHLLDGRMKVHLEHFVACGGATTTSLVSGGQLDALDADTDLVTLTIGGNDIRWGDAVGACLVLGDAACQFGIASSESLITGALPTALDRVYQLVADHAPNAHVVVTGYPHLFSPEYGDYYGASPAEQRAMNDGADLLNEVIAEAAERHGFQFVDVTKRFEGHGTNSTEPWINGPFDAGALHPNLHGYRAYTAALTAGINPARLR